MYRSIHTSTYRLLVYLEWDKKRTCIYTRVHISIS